MSMIEITLKRRMSFFILITGFGTSILIAPKVTYDPINLPKAAFLILCGFTLAGIVFANLKRLLPSINRAMAGLMILFVVQMVFVIFASGAPLTQQIFGTNGRNTGFLTYLSLIFLALAASVSASADMLKRTSYVLILFGALSAAYGLLQAIGKDPIRWNNPYNSVLTFLGNPNFASSSLGMCAVISFALLLNRSRNLLLQGGLLVHILLSIYLTLRSDSIQGVLVFAVGSAVVLAMFLWNSVKRNRKVILGSYLGSLSVIGMVTILGMLNQGPLSSYLYKISVRQRGFYWQAAKEMALSNPLFGVGLDSYGDWYLAKRSANAAFYSPTTQTNSAHNIFLDLGATGGFPLFVVNIALSVLTLVAIFRLVKRQKSFNWALAAIAGAWIAYEAQAIISINQIGLGVWGWILMGLLIGYEYLTRDTNVIVEQKVSTSTNRNSVVGGGLGLLIGGLIAVPFFQADANYAESLKSRDADRLITASLAWPEDLTRTINTANLLFSNSINDEAEKLLLHVLLQNPRNFSAWTLRYKTSVPGSPEYNEARDRLNELDPGNPVK